MLGLKRVPDKIVDSVRLETKFGEVAVRYHEDIPGLRRGDEKYDDHARTEFYEAIERLCPILLRKSGIMNWDGSHDSGVGTKLNSIELVRRESGEIKAGKVKMKNFQDLGVPPMSLSGTIDVALSDGSAKPYQLNSVDMDAIARLEREALMFLLGERERKQLELADLAQTAIDLMEENEDRLDLRDPRPLPDLIPEKKTPPEELADLEEQLQQRLDDRAAAALQEEEGEEVPASV